MMKTYLDVVYDGQWVSIVKLTWQHRTKLLSPSRKTNVYEVVMKETCAVVATIKWYHPLQKYVLFTREETVWEVPCLKEIVAFLEQLTEEWKKNISQLLLSAQHTPQELRGRHSGVAGTQRVEHGPPEPGS